MKLRTVRIQWILLNHGISFTNEHRLQFSFTSRVMSQVFLTTHKDCFVLSVCAKPDFSEYQAKF